MVKDRQNEKIKESIRIERKTKENESSITKTRTYNKSTKTVYFF